MLLMPTLLMAICRVSAELCTSGMQTAVSQIWFMAGSLGIDAV